MEPVNLFDLAAQQSRWLAVRQSAVAGNVANVNTPGYGAVDVEPFEKVLDKTGVAMAATQAGHLAGRRHARPASPSASNERRPLRCCRRRIPSCSRTS